MSKVSRDWLGPSTATVGHAAAAMVGKGVEAATVFARGVAGDRFKVGPGGIRVGPGGIRVAEAVRGITTLVDAATVGASSNAGVEVVSVQANAGSDNTTNNEIATVHRFIVHAVPD